MIHLKYNLGITVEYQNNIYYYIINLEVCF